MSYACDLCNRIFKYPSIFKMHYRSHTGEKPFQCVICSKLFSYESHLVVHKQIHTKKEQYVCELSNKEFLQKSALEEHTELYKDESKDKACVMKGFLNENRQNTTFKPDKLHTCAICCEVFSKESDLNHHFLVHKDVELLSRDRKCDEKLSKTANLSIRYNTREKLRKFICDSCGEAFFEEINFRTHKCVHTEDNPFECNICKKLFSLKNKLNLHRRVHANEKIFEKDKSFSRKDKLKHHRVHADENPFLCNTCGKLFSRKDKLELHHRVHTNEKPFMCNTCGKLFSRKDKLKLHHRVHTNDKPFMCNTCGKLFSRKDKLNFHYRIHIKTEPLCLMHTVKNLR